MIDYYLLGVIAGDGWTYAGRWNIKRKYTTKSGEERTYCSTHMGYVARIGSSNKIFANFLVEKFNQIGLRASLYRTKNPRLPDNPVYVIQVSNKHFVLEAREAFKRLKKTQWSHKTAGDFIRGFFDAEGTIVFGKGKGRRRGQWTIRFYNTDKALLGLIKSLLKRFFRINSSCSLHSKAGHSNGIITSKKDCFQLGVGQRESVLEFVRTIGTYHPKKIPRFQEVLGGDVNPRKA